MQSTPVPSLAPATTLLMFAALGGFWGAAAAVVGVVATSIASLIANGGTPSVLWVAVPAVVIGPLFGVPIGLVTGGGALAGLAIRRTRLGAAIGAGLVAALVAVAGLAVLGNVPSALWVSPVLFVLAAALTPFTLGRVARITGGLEPRATWLMVIGVLLGGLALALGPVVSAVQARLATPAPLAMLQTAPAVDPVGVAAVVSAVLAAAGAVLLVVGLARTRGLAAGQGVVIPFMAVAWALILVLVVVLQVAGLGARLAP